MKTSAAHFKVFSQEVLHWTRFFGLLDWDVVITHQNLPADKDVMAWIAIQQDARYALFGLAEKWAALRPTAHVVAKSAFHEVCHLLLHPIVGKSSRAQEQEHAIIARLENSVFTYPRKKKGTR